MTPIVFLDIPPIPFELQTVLLDLCKKITFNQERLNRIAEMYPSSYVLAPQEYDNEQVPEIPREVFTEFRRIYRDVFQGGVKVILGAATSLSGEPSVTPPHCDRWRRNAINYLLELGGNNVITTIYHEARRDHDLSNGENLTFEEVTPAYQTILPAKQWHAFDPQRYHSVQNIVGPRYYVSLLPLYNFTFNDLVLQYPHLISDRAC
jgi:hypothetical protein